MFCKYDRLQHSSFLKIVQLSVAMIVRNFAAIIFFRLREKPVRLARQHHCIKSYTIFKSKFLLKMINIAFQANPNHVLKLNDFQCGRFEYWRINEIQSNSLLMSTFVLLISNQFHVFLSSSCKFNFYK